MQPLAILFGAALTAVTAVALGTLLLRLLAIRLFALEERLLAFVLGSACLSEIMFALCALGVARRGVLLAAAALILIAAYRIGAHRSQANTPAPLPRTWRWLFGGVFAVFAFLYFINAMAPEMSPDGSAYHLGLVSRYLRAHGFERITTNMYANISQGVELLFLFAFAFGRHSAAALLHFCFLAAMPWLMLSYGRRFGFGPAAAAGALFFFVSPVAGIDGSSAYVDVALAAVVFALFYFLEIWDAERDARLLIPIGILAGFAFAVKYTAGIAIPYAILFVVVKQRRAWFRPALVIAGLALAFVLPWTVKNWLWIGNPVTPFANALFPNPYVHVSFEQDYRRYMQSYGLKSYRQIPKELTLRGGALNGLYGPVFLLAPIALLALRFRAGRRLLLAGAVFGLPYFANIGARFLIPAAPFIALALALALNNLPWLLIILALAQAIACWPAVAGRYCSQYAWRLERIPIRAALRIEREDSYLRRLWPGYVIDRAIEQKVPPGNPVFAFSGLSEAYTSRNILVSFQSGRNEVLRDVLWVAIFPDFQPVRRLDFHFQSAGIRKLRLVQTAATKDAMWSIAEFRVYANGQELARAPEWRLTAQPNPWDVQLAFDNSPVTRWKSWQVAKPGMFMEIDFSEPRAIDGAAIECSPDEMDVKMKLEGLDASGRWRTLSEAPVETIQPITVGLRRTATAEMKARGIRYLLLNIDDIAADDFGRQAAIWGIRPLADTGAYRLYEIE
jgi:hypothetical protein